jgi:hypothetical protein
MLWYKATLTFEQIASGEGTRLQNQFKEIFLAALAPKNMALFGDITDTPSTTFYFSPESYKHAESLVLSHLGYPCEKPDKENVAFLVGDDAAKEDLWTILY